MNAKPVFVFIGVGLILIFASGCTTYNAATGRNEFIMVSTSEEVNMGNRIHQNIAKELKISQDEAFVERVQRIGQRLGQVSDRQDYLYKFFVVENDELNAFTTPGGNIYVHTGLLNKVASDDQLAAVVAHEVGHCAARHTIKKYQASVGYNIIGDLIFNHVVPGGSARSIASMSSNALMKLVFSAYSRGDEYEADRLGLKYMLLAGFDLQGMKEMLELLKSESGDSGALLILRSHPHLDERIETVEKEIETVKQRYAVLK